MKHIRFLCINLITYRLEYTYKELKQCRIKAVTNGHWCLEYTYKELKQDFMTANKEVLKGLEYTYKELKLVEKMQKWLVCRLV